MKVTVEIEDHLLFAVDAQLNVSGQARDYAFAQAIRWWLDHMPKADQWDVVFPEMDDPDGKKLEAYYKEFGW